jgi:hypothetical protein
LQLKLFCAFIDFQKAFDTINRVQLWSKLLKSGVSAKLFNVIYNLYKGAKSYVNFNNQCSHIFQCLIGVRQGENRSPLLFAIFLNDLHNYLSDHYSGLQYLHELLKNHSSDINLDEHFHKILLLLYADDTILMAESINELQNAIDAMSQYCDKWNLKINASKSKILIFSKGKIRNIPVVKFGNNNLEVVFDYVYLGCSFNYNGTFLKAIKRQYDVASRAMFSIISKSRKLQLDIDTQVHLFNTMVIPIMMYGAEVCGYTNSKLIDKLQLRFCKMLLNVKRSTPNVMVLGELGMYPLDIYIKVKMISFWLKLTQSNKCKLSYIMYKLLYILGDVSPWLTEIQSICNNAGFQYIWLSQDVGINVEWLKECIFQRCKDQYEQLWHEQINNSSKCIIYRMYKTEFKFEKYLVNSTFKLRQIYTKFRCRSSRIPIESGICSGTQRQDRSCSLCAINEVGYEFHYIFICPFFKNDRILLLENYFWHSPSAFKMNLLFNTSGKRLKNLCKFIEITMKQF